MLSLRFWDSLKMGWVILSAHPLRSSLTILGIAVGHGVLVATVGIAQGAKRQAEDQLTALGPNIIFVNMRAQSQSSDRRNLAKRLSLRDAEAIAQQIPAVIALAPEIHRKTVVGYGGRFSRFSLIASNAQFRQVRNYQLAQGRFLSDADLQQYRQVVVLGAEVAETFFPTGNSLGQTITIDQHRFEVIGVLSPKGTLWDSNQDDRVIVPLTTATQLIIGQSSPRGVELTLMTVATKDEASTWSAAHQIENLLRVRHQIKKEAELRVNPQKALLKLVYRTDQGLQVMLMAIALVSLLLGGVGVANMMLVSVRERTQEIGLRKALGARSQDIFLQFLIEASGLALSGGLVGIVLGAGSVMVIGGIFVMPIHLSAGVALLALVTSGGLGIVFGIMPAHSAAQLDPIVALRRAG